MQQSNVTPEQTHHTTQYMISPAVCSSLDSLGWTDLISSVGSPRCRSLLLSRSWWLTFLVHGGTTSSHPGLCYVRQNMNVKCVTDGRTLSRYSTKVNGNPFSSVNALKVSKGLYAVWRVNSMVSSSSTVTGLIKGSTEKKPLSDFTCRWCYIIL